MTFGECEKSLIFICRNVGQEEIKVISGKKLDADYHKTCPSKLIHAKVTKALGVKETVVLGQKIDIEKLPRNIQIERKRPKRPKTPKRPKRTK